MSPISKTSFKDWQAEQLNNPEFLAEVHKLEPGYQIARLRIQRGLTQAQLAEMVGTRQPSIARLENGNSTPSLSFLQRIAEALDARIELKLVPDETK
jgi:DNA-binding XRE family transcriptional regulator